MVNVNLWVWAGSSMGQNSEMFNLSQALLSGPPAVLNPPLTGTGVKSAPALILPAFGWAESFPGNARISPKLQVDSHVITYCTDVYIQAKESYPGLQRVVCPHFSLKSEQDPPLLQSFMWRWSWDILADNVWAAQHCPVDDECATSRHSELNWATQNRKGSPKLTCPSPWPRQSFLCHAEHHQVVK